MKTLNLLLYIVLLTGCVNGKSEPPLAGPVQEDKVVTDPLKEIASRYKVKVTPLSVPDGKSKAHTDYSIKIDNLNLESRTGYSPAFLASKSAMLIFRSFSEQEKKSIPAINVHVNSIFKTDVLTFKPADLEHIGPYLDMARSSVERYIAGNYKGFYSLTDPAYFVKLDYDAFIAKYKQPFPEAFEGIEKIEDDGFEYDTEGDLKVIRVYYTTLSSGNKKLEWEIVFLDNGKPPIIGGFHVMP